MPRTLKPRKAPIRMTPVVFVHPECQLDFNNSLGIIAMTERMTVKALILDALKKRNPELTELLNKEMRRSKR